MPQFPPRERLPDVGEYRIEYKQDGSGTFWTNPETGENGHETTRREGDWIAHYRHVPSNAPPVGWRYNMVTGATEPIGTWNEQEPRCGWRVRRPETIEESDRARDGEQD